MKAAVCMNLGCYKCCIFNAGAMSDILRIIVNTDKEDNNNPNITSLREAIVKANQSTSNDKVYIDFVRSNPSPNGYTSWLIQPASALPAITHSDVYINHWSPANVTIDGSNLSRKAGDSYSLLTVGLYSELINNASVNRRVHLRHVNLLNNTVTAGNGVKGGGGGLAAGAGISLLHGDVVLENVVFQNLKAIGGNGSRTPNGVGGSVRNICYGANDENPFCGKNEPLATIPSSGHAGGQGGLPTLLGANIPSPGGGGEPKEHLVGMTPQVLTEATAVEGNSASVEQVVAVAAVGPMSKEPDA